MSAFEQFAAGVAEVRLLLELCSSEFAPAVNDVDRDNAVHRASVVLLVSHFESFLKLVAENFTDSVGSGQLESRQIPKGLRELHTFPKFSEILDCNNETQRAVLLKKLQSVMALWNDTAKPSPGTLKASVLSRTVTNADSETIDGLFSLMGSTVSVCDGDLDIPDDEGETLPSNIRLGLTDVVKCRNDIAHGDVSRRPTDGDLERYIRFLETLAKRLDRKAAALTELVVP
jgi:RiboL-PSP-HEPN